MRKTAIVTGCLIALGLAWSSPTRAGFVADLGANWSDSNNPNTGSYGTWSYRQGTSLLPHVADWTPLGQTQPQPAWAPGVVNGDFLPAEFKATAAQSGFDGTGQRGWQVGDIVTHTTDQFNGGGNGVANFLWTSPSSGPVSITGSVFEARSTTGRNNTWTLLVNGTAISSGTLVGGDGHVESNPFLFASGSGGAGVLTQNIAAGSTIDLQIAETGPTSAGDFVGVNFTISSLTSVPEPSSLVTMGIAAMTGLGYILVRRGSKE